MLSAESREDQLIAFEAMLRDEVFAMYDCNLLPFSCVVDEIEDHTHLHNSPYAANST